MGIYIRIDIHNHIHRCGEALQVAPGEAFCFAYLESNKYLYGTFMPWGSAKNLGLRSVTKGACVGHK
jgi:hypothetical protein